MNDIISTMSPLLVLILPVLLAFSLAFRFSYQAALKLSPWAALPALLYSVFLSNAGNAELPWLFLGSEFGMANETSRLFLLFTSLLWLLSGLFAHSYLARHARRNSFTLFYLLAMSGNFGLILAQDLGSFYLFFALMSFASYGLVVHERTQQSIRAARIYMVLVVIGELALFGAMLLAVSTTGATRFEAVSAALVQSEYRDLVIVLGLVGFGIKAGVIGLHMWLPLAHPVAPSPASAVLSGAMIKAGLLGWLNLLPLGHVAMPDWGQLFMLLGLVSAFYGVIIGLTQREPKTLLAYSSISQMGIMTMMVGLALTAPKAYPLMLVVIVLYAMHHALNKGALFLGVAVMAGSNQSQRHWVWPAIWLPALALAGAPLTSGMLAKAMLSDHTASASGPWNDILPVLLTASAIATTLLMGRLLVLLKRIPANEDSSVGAALTLPWVSLLAAAQLLPWWLAPAASTSLSLQMLLSSLWPLMLGASMIALTLWWNRHRLSKYGAEQFRNQPEADFVSQVPAGDLLLPLILILSAASKAINRLGILLLTAWHHSSTKLFRLTLSWTTGLRRGQSRWQVPVSQALTLPGLAWLLLLAALISLLIFPAFNLVK